MKSNVFYQFREAPLESAGNSPQPGQRNGTCVTKVASLRYFSPRVGKTASFSPAWNCGPTLPRGTFFGNRSSRETSKTRAMKSNSQSGTRRRCDSKLATESRLMLQPRSWSLVAKVAWDQPLLARHFRTCGPMRFIAGFTPCDGNESPGNACVHTNTESACNSKDDVVERSLMMRRMGLVVIQIASFWPGRQMWRTIQCYGNERVNASEMCQFSRSILTELSHKLRKQSLTRQSPH